ncbi:alpha/beta fold hydrolase [Anaeromicropila populeti]|uniref:Pimeloyl-ACP methyl ester carboxylesterase n=1 Tax=Anaeromicropila populeti TaxID=37658 RepID=A0A1I6JWM6_9FIRM|nr:alpha/beta hydrolase [Anaeromicropila populeti]SFR83298.1 Pimeloyl-ACP methyl ester carboxylesterase [Anaeromicropila populeti]
MECIIGNEKISYMQMGKADSPYTMVFIHGATMTGAGMAPLAEQFTDYNCIVVDLPGHGGSAGETKRTVDEFSESIDLFLQELLKNQIISNHITIVGYSMGGGISFELALKQREEYKRLVILCSGAGFPGYVPLVDKVRSHPAEEFSSADFFTHAFGANTTEEQKVFLLDVLNKTKVDDSIGYLDLVAAGTYDKLARANEVTVPVLIVAGDQDQIVEAGCGINLWKSLQNAFLFIIPFRGHTVIFEELEQVVKTMKDFCVHN